MDEVKPTWKIRTLKDAYEPREPTQYVVDRFFATESINILYGAPGVMKSMILGDLCAAVASGQDWLPGFSGDSVGVQVEQCPILWLDIDNGSRRTDERFDALGKARNIPEDAPLHYVSIPNPPLIMTDEESVYMLMSLIHELGAQFVVIDNLGLITGAVEENSAGMAQVMGYLRVVAERTKAAIVLIHHQRKGGANGARLGDALRGHSSIEAAIDLALHVVREHNSKEITIRSTKTRGVDVPLVTAVFGYEHRPGTNDLAKAWFYGKGQTKGKNPVRDMIITILYERPEGVTKGRLVDMVHERLEKKYGINRIRNWIGEMVTVTQEIEIHKGSDNAKIIRLA